MARIELRDATIRLKDGFGGTALVDDTSISGSDTTLEIDTLANLTNARTTVPVGARFTIATVANTTFTVTDANNNEVQQVTVDATSGNFTLTFNGQTTGSIAFDAAASAVQSALEALSNIASGDVVVTGSAGGPWDVEFRGTYLGTNVSEMTATDVDLAGGGTTVGVTTLHAGATTWKLTFTPALDAGDLPADDDAITFLPIQISIKIGEGNLTYTESKEYEYNLDRGDLDGVREGNQVPLEVSMEFVYEFVRTGTGESVTPVDALKGKNGASDWSSASSDLCEPYCVDIEIEHNPPCGTAETEVTIFPDFRYESLEFDLSSASIAVSGRCNAIEPTITRS
jgi:ribosomal protein S11